MANKKTLEERKRELLVKSALQREQLAGLMDAMRKPGMILTSGKTMLESAAKKPMVPAGIALLLLFFFRKKIFGLFRLRKLFSLVSTGLTVVKTWNRFSPWVLPVLRRVTPFFEKK